MKAVTCKRVAQAGVGGMGQPPPGQTGKVPLSLSLREVSPVPPWYRTMVYLPQRESGTVTDVINRLCLFVKQVS